MIKPDFCICENKDADQLLISAFVFATRIVQPLYFLYTKFQASSHLVWFVSLVCVGPGRKSRRPVFSQRGSYYLHTQMVMSVPKLTSKTGNTKNNNSTAFDPGNGQKLIIRGLKTGYTESQPRPHLL